MGYCIGVDVGGTNIAAGLIDVETRRIIEKHSVKTNAPRPCKDISEDVGKLCREVAARASISMSEVMWVGVGAPGAIKDGVVLKASNLGWQNEPLRDILYEIIGRPIFVANDANAAAYAEAKWGSGVGENSVVVITLGTGVGGGIVIDGKIWEGINGYAGEIGHMVVDVNGLWCRCGQRGCFEAYCSATALVSEAKRMMKLYPDSIMCRLSEEHQGRMNGLIPFEAYRLGDMAATQVVDDFIDYLAIGVANVINVFQPAVVCIGGGISAEGDSLMKPLCDKLKYISIGAKDARTRVVAAHFRNDAGIIGAGLLGMMKEN